MSESAPMEGERLSKRVARLAGCSRSEAEHYITSGFVSVDGQVIESPQVRVLAQTVALSPQASLAPVTPVTLLLHKPGGVSLGTDIGNPARADADRAAQSLFDPMSRFSGDRSGIQPLRRHVQGLHPVAPLAPDVAGLVVFTQDPRIRRKLDEASASLEQEFMVEVRGEVTADALMALNRPLAAAGDRAPMVKASVSRHTADLTGLRFAVKAARPGQIRRSCEAAGLTVLSLKRTRIGRIPLAGLPEGQWRYLLGYERF